MNNPAAEEDHHPKYRADIDGLRAVAIVSVLGFHAFPGSMPSGFIGVDAFFVISGFLISSIIYKGLERGNFSFLDFYVKRINRIFPALSVVLISVYAFGWFALFPLEYEQLSKHIVGGIFFVSNFVLMNEVGYFDIAADAKPLIHLWSLAIEEQFYIVWPVLLFFVWKHEKYLSILIIILIFLSFYSNILFIDQSPEFAFYSPLTRFWELLIGCLLACLVLRRSSWVGRCANLQALAGALLFAVGFGLTTGESAFPGWWALFPTLGTFFLISAGERSWLNRAILASPAFVWVGKISYPLYLWHWPLLSYARILQQGTPDAGARVAAVLTSIFLAWATYRFLETPVRFGGRRPLKACIAVAWMACIGAVSFATFQFQGLASRDAVAGLSSESVPWAETMKEYASDCPFSLADYRDCYLFKGGKEASVILVGDSHAGHLVAGMAQTKPAGIETGALILNGGCPPVYGVERLTNNVPMLDYAKTGASCSAINNARLNYILESSAKVIVFSVNGTDFNSTSVKDGSYKYSYDGIGTDNYDALASALKDTVDRLVKAGKHVILVEDNPLFALPRIDRCLNPDRPLAWSNPAKGAECGISREAANHQHARVGALYAQISNSSPNAVTVFDTKDVLCSSTTCSMRKDGKLLYRDADHLSVEGSRDVMRKLFDTALPASISESPIENAGD